jgi:hypothetical protein
MDMRLSSKRVGCAVVFSALISVAQTGVSQSIGGFNLDIVEGNVTYRSGGGATVMTASDLGVSSIMPTDLEQSIVNGQTITAADDTFFGISGVTGFIPPINLSAYAQANMSHFTGPSDQTFLTVLPLDAAFLNHNGTVTTYPGAPSQAYEEGLIAGDLEGLLSGYSVSSDAIAQVDNEQYLVWYTNSLGGLGDLAVLNVNYVTDTIVETAPDHASTASLLGFAVMGLIVHQIVSSIRSRRA